MLLRSPPPTGRRAHAGSYLTGADLAAEIARLLDARGLTQSALADALLESGAESGTRASLRSRIARALDPADGSAAADRLRASMLAHLSHVRAVGPFYLMSPDEPTAGDASA